MLVGLVVGGLSYGAHRPEVLVQSVRFSGNASLSDRELQSLIDEKLEGSYLFLFPKRNIFLYPKRGIEAAVLAAYPRLKHAEISSDSLSSVTFSVEEREPHALWCGENYVGPSEGRGSCYFLDTTGFIFAKAPDFSGNTYFRYYGPLTRGTPIGEQYADPSVFEQLSALVDGLKRTGIDGFAIALLDAPEAEFYLDSGGKILFDRYQNPETLVDNIATVRATEAFTQEDPARLDYIDLRFGNKVYYKYRE